METSADDVHFPVSVTGSHMQPLVVLDKFDLTQLEKQFANVLFLQFLSYVSICDHRDHANYWSHDNWSMDCTLCV